MIRVLVAEDEEHIAKLVLFKLRKEGFEAIWAADGEKALELSLNQRWDAVILDVMMPLQDGWHVLQKLRMSSRSVPVLMLSAKGSARDIIRSEELGATHFLRKPFDPVHLVAVIQEMTSISQTASSHDTAQATSAQGTSEERAGVEAELRNEFIGSFDIRRKALLASLTHLSSSRGEPEADSDCSLEKISLEIRVIAHNIAGVAKSYGFPILGSIAAEIEDRLVNELPLSKLIACGDDLEMALEACSRLRVDCTEISFTSSEGSPAFEATP